MLPPPPLNMTIRKGSKNVALDRVKAEHMVNDQLAIKLQSWLQDTFVPDETYFATLASVKSYNLKVNFTINPLPVVISNVFQKGTVEQDLSCQCQKLGCCTPFACLRKTIWIFTKEESLNCSGMVIRY